MNHQAAESIHERGGRVEVPCLSLDQGPPRIVQLDLTGRSSPDQGRQLFVDQVKRLAKPAGRDSGTD